MAYKLLKTRRLGKLSNICPPTEKAHKYTRLACRYHMCMHNAAGIINTKAKE